MAAYPVSTQCVSLSTAQREALSDAPRSDAARSSTELPLPCACSSTSRCHVLALPVGPLPCAQARQPQRTHRRARHVARLPAAVRRQIPISPDSISPDSSPQPRRDAAEAATVGVPDTWRPSHVAPTLGSRERSVWSQASGAGLAAGVLHRGVAIGLLVHRSAARRRPRALPGRSLRVGAERSLGARRGSRGLCEARVRLPWPRLTSEAARPAGMYL